jgi:hypothetical protein
MKKLFEIKILVESENEQEATKAIHQLGLKVRGCKKVSGIRSLNQNDALHLWLKQISDEANEKGLTIDMLIKNPTEIPITPTILKDFFRLTGKKMFKKDSTAKLDKIEFSELIKVFERAIAERLDIQINFPNIEDLIDKTYE